VKYHFGQIAAPAKDGLTGATVARADRSDPVERERPG
jgi:hypothetical protein